jgi:hypothetical protein
MLSLEKDLSGPPGVTLLALQNAAAVAGLLLTTAVMLAGASKKEAAHGPGA